MTPEERGIAALELRALTAVWVVAIANPDPSLAARLRDEVRRRVDVMIGGTPPTTKETT